MRTILYCMLIMTCLLSGSCNKNKVAGHQVVPKLVSMPDDTAELFGALGFSYSTISEAEKKLVAKLDSIHGTYRDYMPNNELRDLVAHDSASLTHDFSLMQGKGYVDVVTSDDGKLRLYYWDTGQGGTMIDWGNLCQFRAANGDVYLYECSVADLERTDEYTFGCAILGLCTVRADNGDVYYLVHTYVREMSNLGYAEIVPVEIQDSRLVPAPLFDASPDGYGNNCTFREYRFANWYFKTNAGEGWDWPYRYDLATRTLYVPEVIDEEMTDRYNLYTFNGEKFVYTGDDGGYWLHPSIREFKQLELLFCTKDYRIRVDMMEDGTYRYASWSKNVSMENIPDIVICNGAYDEGSRTYSFENDGFQYNVVCEGDNQSKLVVIHDGEQMLQQGQIIEE